MAKRGFGMLTRRRFLIAGGATAIAAPFVARSSLWGGGPSGQLFVSANDDLGERHYVSGFDSNLQRRFSTPMDVRCHGIVLDPNDHHRAVIVARRPGMTAYELDLPSGAIRKTIQTPPDRHFYGHACFSPDGKVFLATENDFTRGQGVIGIYDGRDLTRQGEMSSHGVGPHELSFMADGKTLVIANGGIQTEPEQGRKKLNVSTMDPSLVYVDTRDGKLLGDYRTPDHLAGIRHISLSDKGTVAIAMQHEGEEDQPRPVVAFHDGGEIRFGSAAPEQMSSMTGYVASVCLDGERGRAGFTCPRGGRVMFFDAASGELVRAVEIRDAGGIALTADKSEFLVTNGFGEIFRIDAETLEPLSPPRRFSDSRWDNHVVGI